MSKKIWVNIPQFAKEYGTSPQIIRRHVNHGKFSPTSLKKTKSGKRVMIDLEAGLADLARNLDRVMNRDPKKAQGKTKRDDTEKRNAKSDNGVSEKTKERTIQQAGLNKNSSIAEAQRVQAFYKAALLKLEYEEKSGILVDTRKIEPLFFASGRKIRDKILSIPDRCAALVAAESDQFECKKILKKECVQICDEIPGSAKEVYG